MFIFVFPRCLSHYVHVLLTFYWTLEGPVLWADNLLKGLPLGTATHCYTGHCSWYHWWHPLLTRKTSLVKCHENVRLRCDRLKYSDGCFRCCILSDSIDRLLLLHPRINHWLWRQPFLKFLESLARKLLEDRWVIPASASRSRQVEHTQIRLGQGKWRWSLIMILYDYQWSWALMMIDDHDLWWWSVIMILDDDQWSWSLMMINDHDPWWWSMIMIPDDDEWSWSLMMINDHDPWWWSMIMILADDQRSWYRWSRMMTHHHKFTKTAQNHWKSKSRPVLGMKFRPECNGRGPGP